MHKLDRTIAPERKQISDLQYTLPALAHLDNGIAVHCIDAAEKDLLRVELLFDAGEWHQDMPLQASSCVQMLNEGCTKYTGTEIADKLDFYGSFIFLNSQKHTATVTLYSLGQFLEPSLEILADMLMNPVFPEPEFAVKMGQKLQSYHVENEKVESIAARTFMQSLFGKAHPYGAKLTEDDFARIGTADLRRFHQRCYGSASCRIIVAGKVGAKSIEAINRYLGQNTWGDIGTYPLPDRQIEPSAQRKVYIERPHAVQTALRIGIPLFNKLHPDYRGMQVLNTILGGYFGSRLMANIREDKGYTYGIHSSLASLQETGYFVISSQVGKDVRQEAVAEIYKEIQKLCDEPVTADELEVVKNYMLGQILRYFDGPFNLGDTMKSLMDYGLDFSHYRNVIAEINRITPEDLQALAQKYWGNADFYEILVG